MVEAFADREVFKFSNDPHFAPKVRDIVGLYMNPPDKAIVLSVDASGFSPSHSRCLADSKLSGLEYYALAGKPRSAPRVNIRSRTFSAANGVVVP